MHAESITDASDPREHDQGVLIGELPWPRSRSSRRAFEPAICGALKENSRSVGYLPCSEWAGHVAEGLPHAFEAVRVQPSEGDGYASEADYEIQGGNRLIAVVVIVNVAFWIALLWLALVAFGGR